MLFLLLLAITSTRAIITIIIARMMVSSIRTVLFLAS